MFLGIGLGELIVILIVFVLLINPKNIPHILADIKLIKQKVHNFLHSCKLNINDFMTHIEIENKTNKKNTKLNKNNNKKKNNDE